MYFILTFVLILTLFISCQKNHEFYRVKKIDEDIWRRENVLSFEFEIKDSQLPYNISIDVQHTDDYPKANLWLFTSIRKPNFSNKKDTIELTLSRFDGKWLGKKKWSNWQISTPIKSNFFFDSIGIYTIKVEHAMRFKNVSGIKAIGVSIQKN